MSTYVDNMRVPYRTMVMCHLVADSHGELMEMVDAIGVQQKWIQHEGTNREHFDISLGKRVLAIRAGAIEITRLELNKILKAR